MEIDQPVSRFAVSGSGGSKLNAAAVALAEDFEATHLPVCMEMAVDQQPAAGDTGLEDLIARFVDVTVYDRPVRGEAAACAVRVRLPDGQVFDRVFGAAQPVATLFCCCQTVFAACGVAGRPFRLVRFAGGASDEIPPRGDVSFRDLGLDRCIVHVIFSP